MNKSNKDYENDLERYRKNGKKDPRIPFYFEIHLIDACNLNCAGCDHFAPLAQSQSYYPIDILKKDLLRVYELFGRDVHHLHILGGEPLICKNIEIYLDIARKCLPTTALEIITNGILLKEMPDSFYESCKKNKVKICVSIYPINLDYDEVFNFVKNKGVEIEIFALRTSNIVWKNMGLSQEYLLDYNNTFLECKYAGNCSNLKNGKLYFCPHGAYIDIFNTYFDEHFDNSNAGISIYEHTKEEIIDFIRTPNEFCKYCHINDPQNKRVAWTVSRRNKEEWIFKP